MTDYNLTTRLGALRTGLSAAVVLAAFVGNGLAQTERLAHTPVATATAGRGVTLEATVQGASSAVVSGTIYFRRPGEGAFVQADMTVRQDQVVGEIAAQDVREGRLEYWLEVTLESGLVLTYPEAGAAEPMAVDVKPARAPATVATDGVVVLSPEPGSRLTGPQVLAAASFLQTVQPIDPARVQVWLDKTDRTAEAQVTREMVTLVVTDLKPGTHTVELKLTGEPPQTLAQWSFVLLSPEVMRRLPGQVSGKVKAGYAHENISSRVRNITYLDGQAQGKLGIVEWNGRAYVTNLERGYLQPQNRFLLGLRAGGLGVKVGDTYPRFSEFTLWGTRNRGAELNFVSPAFNLDVSWGFARRGVDGRVDSVVVTDPTTGLPVTTAQYTYGTYARKIIALRPGFPISKYSAFSFTIVKARDDTASAAVARNPVDNLVLGADLQVQSNSRRLTFTSEFALSGYNSNIAVPTMRDAEKAKDIIVINQYFDPLPTDSLILDPDKPLAKKMSSFFKEVMKSATAHRTTLSLNYFRNEVNLGYRRIGRSFHSLGSPTLETDIAGWSFEDRLRLMNNRLYITVGYEDYNDNVSGRGETTLDRKILRGGISVYTPRPYPNLSFGYRTYNRKNDGSVSHFTDPMGNRDSTDTRVKNTQNSYNLSLDQSFRLSGFEHTASLYYNNSTTDDAFSALADNSTRNVTLALNSRGMGSLETQVSFSLIDQKSLGDANALKYNDISLGGRYTVIPRMLWVNGGLGISTASGGNDQLSPSPTGVNPDSVARSFTLDYTRTKINLGATYQPRPRHTFGLEAYAVSHAENSYTVYYSGRRLNLADTPTYRKQNDLAARLSYTYEF